MPTQPAAPGARPKPAAPPGDRGALSADPLPGHRCGIDSVEIARIERLLRDTPADGLTAFFSPQELDDAGDGPGRAASLAARFAAKEACLKLFPREAALGQAEITDFSVARDAYGAPQLVCNANAQYLLDRHRIAAVKLSLTHDRHSASAVALGAFWWVERRSPEPLLPLGGVAGALVPSGSRACGGTLLVTGTWAFGAMRSQNSGWRR